MTRVTIYYFTGTGNTLALARAASKALGSRGHSVKIIDMAKAGPGPAELIGIFFPVYAYGPPRLVRRFLEQLPPAQDGRAFVVANAAESPGPAAASAAAVLRSRGYRVTAADWVAMPSNYILGGEAVPEEEAREVVSRGEDRAAEIAMAALEDGGSPPKGSWSPFYRLVHRAFILGTGFIVGLYRASDRCVGCGVCAAMCPVGAISMNAADRPLWSKSCEHCMRCVNHCPHDAIEVSSATVGKRRYKYFAGRL